MTTTPTKSARHEAGFTLQMLGLDIDLDVRFRTTSYDPGDRWTPPHGGGIENVEMVVEQVHMAGDVLTRDTENEDCWGVAMGALIRRLYDMDAEFRADVLRTCEFALECEGRETL